MYPTIIRQDPIQLATTADARRQCRLFDADTDDTLVLDSALSSARMLAQAYCNRMLSSGEVRATWHHCSGSPVKLWGGNVNEVTSLDYFNETTGETGTVDEADYNFISANQNLYVYANVPENATLIAEYSVVVGDVPPFVRSGILHLTETLFNNRGDIAIGITANELPLTSRTLLDGYRHYAA